MGSSHRRPGLFPERSGALSALGPSFLTIGPFGEGFFVELVVGACVVAFVVVGTALVVGGAQRALPSQSAPLLVAGMGSSGMVRPPFGFFDAYLRGAPPERRSPERPSLAADRARYPSAPRLELPCPGRFEPPCVDPLFVGPRPLLRPPPLGPLGRELPERPDERRSEGAIAVRAYSPHPPLCAERREHQSPLGRLGSRRPTTAHRARPGTWPPTASRSCSRSSAGSSPGDPRHAGRSSTARSPTTRPTTGPVRGPPARSRARTARRRRAVEGGRPALLRSPRIVGRGEARLGVSRVADPGTGLRSTRTCSRESSVPSGACADSASASSASGTTVRSRASSSNPEDLARAVERREEIVGAVRSAGYAFVALDLVGYRSGSANEVVATRDRTGCAVFELGSCFASSAASLNRSDSRSLARSWSDFASENIASSRSDSPL